MSASLLPARDTARARGALRSPPHARATHRPLRAALALVKLGEKKRYYAFEHADLRGMHAMALLKALAKDEGFAASLKDKELDDCAVLVIKSAQEEAPTAAEEASAVELSGARTIGSVASGAAMLFIRVDLPATPSGSCRCSPPVLR